jgi:hypothetical protein
VNLQSSPVQSNFRFGQALFRKPDNNVTAVSLSVTGHDPFVIQKRPSGQITHQKAVSILGPKDTNYLHLQKTPQGYQIAPGVDTSNVTPRVLRDINEFIKDPIWPV